MTSSLIEFIKGEMAVNTSSFPTASCKYIHRDELNAEFDV
jgi:hypothetical protein